MHAILTRLMASAVQFAEAAGPTTKLDWIQIAIIDTVVGGVLLLVIVAATKRSATAIKTTHEHATERAAQRRQEQSARQDRIATDVAQRTRENWEADSARVEQEQLVQLHAAGGQRVVRHERHPRAPGATVAHFSDGTYGIYFNRDMARYKAFVESNPGEWRHSHPWQAPSIGKSFGPSRSRDASAPRSS